MFRSGKVASQGIVFLLMGALLVFSGCGGAKLNKEAMVGLNKIGILSVTVDRVGPDTENNVSVMKQVANEAFTKFESKLKIINNFKIVPQAEYRDNEHYKNICNFSKSAGAQKFIKNFASKNKNSTGDVDITADVFNFIKKGTVKKKSADEKEMERITSVTSSFQKLENKTIKRILSAEGTPPIHYSLVSDIDYNGNKSKVMFGNASSSKVDKQNLKSLMIKSISDLCKELGLDGMLIVTMRAKVEDPGTIMVASGDRICSTIKLNPTLILVTKDGKIAIDMDYPGMDDLAPKKLAQPAFLKLPGTMKVRGRNGRTLIVTKRKMDLMDPKQKVLKAYLKLVDKTSSKLVNELKDSLKKG